jgi:hypothetical protein
VSSVAWKWEALQSGEEEAGDEMPVGGTGGSEGGGRACLGMDWGIFASGFL